LSPFSEARRPCENTNPQLIAIRPRIRRVTRLKIRPYSHPKSGRNRDKVEILKREFQGCHRFRQFRASHAEEFQGCHRFQMWRVCQSRATTTNNRVAGISCSLSEVPSIPCCYLRNKRLGISNNLNIAVKAKGFLSARLALDATVGPQETTSPSCPGRNRRPTGNHQPSCPGRNRRARSRKAVGRGAGPFRPGHTRAYASNHELTDDCLLIVKPARHRRQSAHGRRRNHSNQSDAHARA